MMLRRDRIRRTAKLCLNCLQNCAFLRGSESTIDDWKEEQFWVGAYNNFVDIAVLEWCKVFGDVNGKHYWRKSVTDQQMFLNQLLNRLHFTEAMFDAYILEMKTYRDKFVAHLDEGSRMYIPKLTAVIKSSQLLYQHLHDVEDDCDALPHDAPPRAYTYFRRFLVEADAVYANKAENS